MRAVPSNLLLWLALLAGVPAAALLFRDPGGAGMFGGAALLILAGAGAVDRFRSRRVFDVVEVQSPELVRATKGKRIDFRLDLVNRGPSLPALRCGLSLSPAIRFEDSPVKRLGAFEGGRTTQLAFPMVALRRGRHELDEAHLETPSRWRLWLMRKGYGLDTEFRVYPDLRSERRRLASRFLLRGQAGQQLVRQVGKGRDFEQLRDYQPGDDYVDIDWKATARRLSPMTRTYQIERTQEVYVVVDHSRLSAREIRVPYEEEGIADDWRHEEDSQGGNSMVTTQLEKFLHCALILASVAERQGDRFGFVSFADRVGRFLRAGNGRGHFNLVRDQLYTLEPRRVAPDFEELMVSLRKRLTRRALIVMLVDLSDPLTAEQFQEALPLINRQHLVLVNMIRPTEARPLFSARDEPEALSDVYESLAGHFQWQDLRELARKLARLGVELGTPDHAEICADTVTQYLNVKHRQAI